MPLVSQLLTANFLSDLDLVFSVFFHHCLAMLHDGSLSLCNDAKPEVPIVTSGLATSSTDKQRVTFPFQSCTYQLVSCHPLLYMPIYKREEAPSA